MWAIALHGGATEVAPDKEAAYRDGCLAALAAGRVILEGGGSAVDATAAAVQVLEDDPTFNAGCGSARNEAGDIEMCAALMNGHNLKIGAVGVIRDVRHPIGVAMALMDENEVLLAGDGARRFAEAKGLTPPAVLPLRVAQESGAADRQHDTVGCVARDSSGRLAAATSTGGLEGVRVGRVGDSAMPGCGFYADDSLGAVVLSGDGEMIARAMAAGRILLDARSMAPDEAIRRALAQVAALEGEAGAVLVTPTGLIVWDHTSRDFCVASQCEGEAGPTVSLGKAQG
ncbi:isoaspartyl peptidase/L-asparaginase family protein [Rubellimicrobium arenae]|uniref:isoaspartyl peptidase/L-asparaginase family protein n=1 Tax=Rubellimicrobium arenae TaxID=2817372 RepID=UPI001B31160B|nr:isoaspartyl peptidase/L-asparaginase family protein [Rubellimicrobium arenae]